MDNVSDKCLNCKEIVKSLFILNLRIPTSAVHSQYVRAKDHPKTGPHPRIDSEILNSGLARPHNPEVMSLFLTSGFLRYS